MTFTEIAGNALRKIMKQIRHNRSMGLVIDHLLRQHDRILARWPEAYGAKKQ